MGQTVNLLRLASVVRIHHHPRVKGGPKIAVGSPFFISNLYIFLNDFC